MNRLVEGDKLPYITHYVKYNLNEGKSIKKIEAIS